MPPPPSHRFVASGLAAILVLQASGAPACVNTRYSRAEERQLTGDTVKLIMGQFAHHGTAFYEQEIRKTTAELDRDPGNIEARNDRAVAFLKMKRFAIAESELLKIEDLHPGRYRTQANLGVLYKKMGRFEAAAQHVRRSLEIQPEGHLGLGDYYVRMIDWLADRKNDPPLADREGEPNKKRVVPPATNFLGIAYSAGPRATATNGLANREFLETLVKADRSFADALFVLGDLLNQTGDKELACRAYYRARLLGHPAETALRNRLRGIHDDWEAEANQREGYIVLPAHEIQGQIENEAQLAADWVGRYETTEGEAVEAGNHVDISEVKRQMSKVGGTEPVYVFTGVVKGKAIQRSREGLYLAIGIFLGVVWVWVLGVGGLSRVLGRRRHRRPVAA